MKVEKAIILTNINGIITNRTNKVREAFQIKKRGNLGNGPNQEGGWGGGRPKIKKVPSFRWKNFKIKGGSSEIKKSPKFQRVPKTNKMIYKLLN